MFIFIILLSVLLLLAAVFVSLPYWPSRQYYWPFGLIAVTIISALCLYQYLGRGEHIRYAEQDQQLRQIAMILEGNAPIPAMLATDLKASLLLHSQQRPKLVETWLLLAKLALLEDDFSAASQAYAQAHQLHDDDIDILFNLAYTQYLADERQFSAATLVLVEQIRQQVKQQASQQLSPHSGSLTLLAIAALAAQDYPQAIHYGRQALSLYPLESSEAQNMQAIIAVAQEQMNNN